MSRRAFVATLTLLFALAAVPAGAVVSDAVDRVAQPADGAAEERREADLAADLYERLNDERAARGLHPLRWDPALADLAHDWSATMAATGDYRHRPHDERDLPGYAGIGENIYQLLVHYESTGYAHRGWMRSTGHRNNIVNPGYDAVGIGVYCADDGTMWATQNLGRYELSTAPSLFYGDSPAEPIIHDGAGGLSCKDLPTLPLPDGSGPAPAADLEPDPPSGVTYLRAAGATRIETAVQASRTLFDDGAEFVVLASAGGFADALTGAVLAGAADGPVLLTPKRSVPDGVRREIERLDPSTVYVLGGPSSIADDALHGLPGRVVRVAGADRYATAARAAEEFARLRHGSPRHVYVANGVSGWPDAVAVSGLAAYHGDPLLLATRDGLPVATRRALVDHGVAEATLVGGTAVASEALAAELRDLGVRVRRIGGESRYETAALARAAALRAGMAPDVTLVATLRDWPDSLVVGAAAARHRGIVLSVAGASADAEPQLTYTYAEEYGADIEHVTVIGGRTAVSDAVVSRLFAHMDR